MTTLLLLYSSFILTSKSDFSVERCGNYPGNIPGCQWCSLTFTVTLHKGLDPPTVTLQGTHHCVTWHVPDLAGTGKQGLEKKKNQQRKWCQTLRRWWGNATSGDNSSQTKSFVSSLAEIFVQCQLCHSHWPATYQLTQHTLQASWVEHFGKKCTNPKISFG